MFRSYLLTMLTSLNYIITIVNNNLIVVKLYQNNSIKFLSKPIYSFSHNTDYKFLTNKIVIKYNLTHIIV